MSEGYRPEPNGATHTIESEQTAADRKEVNNLFRFSVGIEDHRDLIESLEHAFNAAKSTHQ